MNPQLIQHASDESSSQRLKQVYETGLIAPEKKPFLVDLKKSIGPYLAIAETDQFILDGCSQIATLGLGFNASPLFAPCHHLESWTGDYRSDHILTVAKAYRNLLKRLSGHHEHDVHFCGSGAEAVEISLGLCFENRANKSAKRVLAFEGSFHGRMMVALASTSNPKKREPFAWPGHESDFVPYPFIHGNKNLAETEKQCLAAVDKKLASGQFFAVLIEPMQCEGGDRYSSASFHQRLLQLVRKHNLFLVYDEVQTGFHLGNSFFWHSQFELKDDSGNLMGPDVVCCAKKSQVGAVIHRFDNPYRERFCPASLVRGYASASVLDQFADKIREIETYNLRRLGQLMEAHPDLIANGRGQGFAFAFDFNDNETVAQFVGRRFPHGLLFYPAGQRTARFRVNLACKPEDLDQLWTQIEACLIDAPVGTTNPVNANFAKVASDYEFHTDLVLQQFNPESPETACSTIEYLNQQLETAGIADAVVNIVDQNNYAQFRSQILQMQQLVYEPIRQTPAEEFDDLFADASKFGPIAIVVTKGDQIVTMAFCGRLGLFAAERGVTDDPFFGDETVYYMVDLTVAKEYRGGIGRIMKNAIAMLALSKGVTAIHGRNRDRLAAGMWAINLSLGAFETQHLVDDYQDEHQFRDCIYYRMPVCHGETEPLDVAFNTIASSDLDREFVSKNMPAMVNKVCLSNFVTNSFLNDLQCVAECMPDTMRHVYTASSLSECVDKITKAIWLKRKPVNHLLTIDNHYFDEGSFLARSLSGSGEPYFDVTRLQPINAVKDLESEIKRKEPIAFYVQVEHFSGGGEEDLCDCVAICRRHGIPIVFNETGPRFGTARQFSRIEKCQPDASIVWLGGQMALAFTTSQYFADDPLLLISTWDGDAFSLARFAQFVRKQND